MEFVNIYPPAKVVLPDYTDFSCRHTANIHSVQGPLPSYDGKEKYQFMSWFLDEAPRVRIVPNVYDIVIVNTENLGAMSQAIIYRTILDLRDLEMFERVEFVDQLSLYDQRRFDQNYLFIHTFDHTWLSHVPTATLDKKYNKYKKRLSFYSAADLKHDIKDTEAVKKSKYNVDEILQLLALDYDCDHVREISMGSRVVFAGKVMKDKINLDTYFEDVEAKN